MITVICCLFRKTEPGLKKMEDNIPADVKQRRLAEVIALQGEFLENV
jgi:tRNA-2-methylthio-N6-dimethylallyladenosine synthase